MIEFEIILASIISMSAPLVLAVVGETISERVGIVNLSLEGTLLITAMVGFAVASVTGIVLWGFIAASLLGGLIAFLICFANITLHINQIAVGFTLTILLGKLSSYLGQPFVRIPGPYTPQIDVPFADTIPIIGKAILDQNIIVWISILSIFISWWFIYKTKSGLILKATGENPYSAAARGINVRLVKYIYGVLGGSFIGLAGASFSLHSHYGWSNNHTLNYGWICLAIVIFGGWNPVRGALGAYAFGALQIIALKLQGVTFGLSQVLPLIPFPLMILSLVLIQYSNEKKLLPDRVRRIIFGNMPEYLGITYKRE
jgi:simple sugar transport system permease protein